MRPARTRLPRPALQLLALASALVGIVVVATPGRADAAPATRQVVLRPVTAAGHPAAGWRVITDSRPPVACTVQSPWSVSGGVDWCGSSADDTPACWRSATAHRVLCLDDVWSHTLRSIRLDGPFETHAAVSRPRPVALTVADHMRFRVRVGGAWAALRQHPSWVGWYYQRGGAHTIYGPRGSGGIDTAHATWAVTRYGDPSRPGQRITVGTAYLLATAH